VVTFFLTFDLQMASLCNPSPSLQQRDLDDLFFGSSRVALRAVPGDAFCFDRDEWAVDMTASALAKTRARSKRLAVKDGGAADVVVPCIPAREIIISTTEPSQKDVSAWPEELQHPLLKVPLGTSGSTLVNRAVASGVRSCLVKVESKEHTAESGKNASKDTRRGSSYWYRLKGSGNHDQGFVVRHNSATPDAHGQLGKPAFRDIRGSAFIPTAMRENFMTARIGAALEPLGIPACNEAMGFYTYDPPNCPLGTSNSEVVPACIIERTRGDRRLGSHVLTGIELLLPSLLDSQEMTPEFLQSLFPPKRRSLRQNSDNGGNEPGRVPSTAELTYYHAQLLQAGEAALWTIPEKYHSLVEDTNKIPSTGSGKGKKLTLDSSVLANMFHDSNSSTSSGRKNSVLPERAPLSGEYPQQWTAKGPRPMGDDWKPLWDETVRSLASALQALRTSNNNMPQSVLGYLFWHIGRDCGRFLRELHRLQISWGTYQDEMCRRDYDEWHCNAHANNVVLLPEEEGQRLNSFLCYLDLDMSFDDETFVDIWAPKEATNSNNCEKSNGDASPTTTGLSQKTAHDALLARENANFMEVLAGGDSSNGVPQIARTVVDSQTSEIATAKAALYDTLIFSYQKAYKHQPPEGGAVLESSTLYSPELHKAAYAICKLAIIVMADFVA